MLPRSITETYQKVIILAISEASGSKLIKTGFITLLPEASEIARMITF